MTSPAATSIHISDVLARLAREHISQNKIIGAAGVPIVDFQHSYLGYGVHVSRCRVRIFASALEPSKLVVVMTDVEGTSVTNAADQIAAEVLAKLGGEPMLDRVVFVEHYEAERYGAKFEETFAYVTFSSYDAHGPYYARVGGRGFSGTSFHHLTKIAFEQLIGGSL